jgi:hypothetical protein
MIAVRKRVRREHRAAVLDLVDRDRQRRIGENVRNSWQARGDTLHHRSRARF